MIDTNYDFPSDNNENKMNLSIKNLIVVIGLGLIFEVLTGFGVAIVKGNETQAFMQSSIGTIVLSLASNCGYMLSIFIVYGFKETLYDLFKKTHKATIIGVKWGLIAIGLNFVIAFVMSFIYQLFKITPVEQNITQVLKSLSGLQLFISMSFASFIVPIFEEIIFRGVIQRTMQEHSSVIRGLILTSLAFAVIHFDWYQLPSLFTLGLCFGIAYNKSGSIYSPIAAHIVNNAFAMLLMLLAL